MPDQSYKLRLTRVFGQSLFIWLWLLFYPVAMSMAFPRASREKEYFVLVVISIFFGLLIIPGIAIFLNYWKCSKHLELIVSRQSICLLNNVAGTIIEINNLEVAFLTIYKNNSNRLPWGVFEYFSVEGNSKTIIIPSFIISFNELASAGFLTEIINGELIQKEKLFPIVPT